MKATLEFDLEDGQDRMAHLRCIKAVKMAITLWDIDQYLRSHIKYAPDTADEKTVEVLQEVRDELRKIMSDNSIDLDELIN